MFSQINRVHQKGRFLISIARKNRKNICLQERLTTASQLNDDSDTSKVDSSSVEKLNASNLEPVKDNGISPTGNRMQMLVLKQNLPDELDLKLLEHREGLVTDFYNLSQSVIEDKIKVEDFVNSGTFTKLQNQLEIKIESFNNAVLVNLLASTIKMGMDPSVPLMKLLENEIKSRVKSLNLNQTIKLIQFYKSKNRTQDQQELVDDLITRVPILVHEENKSVKDLNSAFHLVSIDAANRSLLPLIEESLLNILALNQPEDEDMVTRYLTPPSYDSENLCNIIIHLADLKRRPVPLLKITAKELRRMSKFTNNDNNKVPLETLIATLDALDRLNYPNRLLVAQLIDNITSSIELDKIDSYTACSLLRSIGALRWRANDLLEVFFNHVKSHNNNIKMIDRHVMVALLHVTSLLNYKPKCIDLKEFYKTYMKNHIEDQLDKRSKKWLNYVWNLVHLNLADEKLLKSVLSKKFLDSVSPLNYSDSMKLLNLYAIARYELKMERLSWNHLIPFMGSRILRKSGLQKLAILVDESMNTIVESPETNLRQNIPTPFGFNIDYELKLDADRNPLPLDVVDLFELGKKGSQIPTLENPEHQRHALIFQTHEDSLANERGLVSHKLMVERILRALSYQTVFLPANELSSAKNTLEIVNILKRRLGMAIDDSEEFLENDNN